MTGVQTCALPILAVALGAGAAWWRGRAAPVDPSLNVVAIAPFRVSGADPSLHYLRDGMVDLLAAKVAGIGGLRFAPTSDPGNMEGVLSQTKAAFVYGGGADFNVAHHIGMRVDYRGFVTKPPDFTLSSLTLGSTTHLAQPSIGIFFRF